MKNIPLIIPVFNQPTYLKNLINWWKWYYPDSLIFIVDNGSTCADLSYFYNHVREDNLSLHFYEKNDFIANLTAFMEKFIKEFPYYVISDPDIMPHPNTPPNFLEVWKNQIENHNYHRVGFNLITSDLPESLNERAMIIGNEKELLAGREAMTYGAFTGYKVPIDTTFCLYSAANGGWKAPMDGQDWGNCLRLFDAFHLGWYVQEPVNPEMEYYFTHSKYRVPGEPSAGKNNNRPQQFMK